MREQFESVPGILSENQGQDLPSTVLFVPYSISSGLHHVSAITLPRRKPYPVLSTVVRGLSRRGAARADDAQEAPTQSHISPSIRVYEEKMTSVGPPQDAKQADSWGEGLYFRIFQGDKEVLPITC